MAENQANTLPAVEKFHLDPADIVRETLRIERECCRAIERQRAFVQVLPDGREILHGPAYRARRQEALERDGHKCTRCGSSGLQVHHRIKRSVARDDRLENLETLCERCHDNVHTAVQ
jgi:5-methylcytosine-specific restriction endonuclease McrA